MFLEGAPLFIFYFFTHWGTELREVREGGLRYRNCGCGWWEALCASCSCSCIVRMREKELERGR